MQYSLTWPLMPKRGLLVNNNTENTKHSIMSAKLLEKALSNYSVLFSVIKAQTIELVFQPC
jgi:hypothetical protein